LQSFVTNNIATLAAMKFNNFEQKYKSYAYVVKQQANKQEKSPKKEENKTKSP